MSKSNTTNQLFETNVNLTYDKCPIILIDCSGSTSGSIFNYENDSICKLLNQRNVNKGHLMYWSSQNYYYVIDEPVDFDNGDNLRNKYANDIQYWGTDLLPALNRIPSEWFHSDSVTDLYIVTDGQIGDNPSDKLKQLTEQFHIRISIITININTQNYVNNNIGAGGSIYNCLRNSELLTNCREFLCINKYHLPNNPYQNTYNPEQLDGLVPFQAQYFRIEKLNQFIEYIGDVIDSLDTESDDYPVILDRISYDLIITLKHLTHGASPTVKNHMINLLSQLFIDTPLEISIDARFRGEANDNKVMSCTFEEYRDKRDKLFKRGYNDITNSLKHHMTKNHQKTYHTFPIKTNNDDYVIIQVTNSQVKEDVKLGMATYGNAGVKVDGYTFPVLPAEKHSFDMYTYMCFRQWIRANYSQLYNLNAADDMTMYLFMADMLRVFLKTPNILVRNSIGRLMVVMLSRARYGSGGVLEKQYLLNGNPPAPVTMPASYMPTLLNEVRERLGFPSIHAFTLWFAIVVTTGDVDLVKSQLTHCIDDIQSDFPDINTDNISSTANDLIRKLRAKFTHKVDIIDNKQQVRSFDMDLDYMCIFTLEDTSDVGGYVINPHKLSSKVTCNPRFVISKEGFEDMKKNSPYPKCPICHQGLDYKTSFSVVQSRKEEAEMKKREGKTVLKFEHQLNDRYHNLYSINNHSLVIDKEFIGKLMKKNNSLIPIDICNFEPQFIKDVNVLNIRHKMNGAIINYTTTEEFVNHMNQEYRFLNQISYDNIAVAGGFCRSILLNQSVNDIDIFIHGINPIDVNLFRNRLDKLIIELVNSIDKQYNEDKMVYTFLYKPRYNVLEMLCFQNLSKKDISNDVITAYKSALKAYQVLSSYYKYLNVLGNDGEITDFMKEQHETYKDVRNIMKGYSKEHNGHYLHLKSIQILEKFCGLDDNLMSKRKYSHNINGIRDYGNDLVELLEKISINLDLKHKIQIILQPNKNKKDIVKLFDISASKVVYDGETVTMTKDAYFSYKYMFNYVDKTKFSDHYYKRLIKYFGSGFNILAPEYDTERLNKPVQPKTKPQLKSDDCAFVTDSDDSEPENDDDRQIIDGQYVNDEGEIVDVEELERVKDMWNNINCDVDEIVNNKTIIVNALKQYSKNGTTIKGMGGMYQGMYHSFGSSGNQQLKPFSDSPKTDINDDIDDDDDEEALVELEPVKKTEKKAESKETGEIDSMSVTQKFRNLLLNIITIELIDGQPINVVTMDRMNMISIPHTFEVNLEDRIGPIRRELNQLEYTK